MNIGIAAADYKLIILQEQWDDDAPGLRKHRAAGTFAGHSCTSVKDEHGTCLTAWPDSRRARGSCVRPRHLGSRARRGGTLDLGARHHPGRRRARRLSITRDLAGRVGVDAIALVSMSATLLLGETLADVVVAVYAGGNVLEDFAVARTERNLKSLVDRRGWRPAQRTRHRGHRGRAGGGRRRHPGARRRDHPDRGRDRQRRRPRTKLTGEPIPVSRGKSEPAL